MTLRNTFNQVAAAYDKARSGYPDALFADLKKAANLGPNSRLLEVGCGTGKATVPMARVGAHTTAIDIGPKMLKFAAKKCAKFKNVAFQQVSFEDFDGEPGSFDLIYFATSAHWIKPSLLREKCAKLLKTGGHVAIMQHLKLRDKSPLRRALSKLHREIVPDLQKPPQSKKSPERRVADMTANLAKNGRYAKAVVSHYPMTTDYTAKEYTALLGTVSYYIHLRKETRKKLFAKMEKVIPAHGGATEREDCVLILGRKKR